MIKILTDTCDNFEKTNAEKGSSQKLDEIFDLLKKVADHMFSDFDTEIASDANKSLHKNTDKNESSPSMLDSRPLRKRSRLAFYPVVKDATVIENITLVNNNKTDIEDETCYLPAEQTANNEELLELSSDTEIASDANKSLHKNTDKNESSPSMLDSRPLRKRSRLAFYPAVKDATVIENSTLVNNNKTDIEDKTFYLPAEQTGNKNEMDNFNLYDIENKPPKKETLLDKFNIWSKRKDISQQRNMRCKAERAKLTGWDCWECREYYNNLSLSKEDLQKRKNQCSRHRRKYERPNTPEGFWNPVFPETLSTLTE